LATLYPHVSALQTPYYHADFTTSEWYGDNTVGYWAGAYASPEAPEYKIDESRRGSGVSSSPPCPLNCLTDSSLRLFDQDNKDRDQAPTDPAE